MNLIEAAKAVVARWDSPDWHDGTHTGEYIARLRAAIEEAEKQEPVEMPDLDSNIVNDAAWAFIESLPHKLPPEIFNDLKPAIYAALVYYHRAMSTAPQPIEAAELQSRGPAQKAEQAQAVWAPIDTAPKARTVLVYYKNRADNGRTMRATYYPPETLESDISDSGWADEGWYEESEAYEYLMPLQGEPTHWMPLPPPPDAPQPPQPARKPMTEEEIDAIVEQTDRKHGGGDAWAANFARAVEHHHGIGGNHD